MVEYNKQYECMNINWQYVNVKESHLKMFPMAFIP